MSTYTQVRNDFSSLCEQVGFSDTLREKALDCFDAGIAAGLDLLLEEEGLDELAGKGRLFDILSHHSEKEDEFRKKLKASRGRSPIKRQATFANWKKHGAKAKRAAELLDKIKEDADALASVSGNSLANYRGTSDNDPRTWPERLDAELDELLRKLEALHAEIQLSKDGLSKNSISKYVQALRRPKGPTAKDTIRSGDKVAQLESTKDVFQRNRLKREIMHEQFVQSVKDWNVKMLSKAGITGYGKAPKRSDWSLESNTEWLKKRIDRKDRGSA